MEANQLYTYKPYPFQLHRPLTSPAHTNAATPMPPAPLPNHGECQSGQGICKECGHLSHDLSITTTLPSTPQPQRRLNFSRRSRDSLSGQSAGLVIERMRVRITAETAG